MYRTSRVLHFEYLRSPRSFGMIPQLRHGNAMVSGCKCDCGCSLTAGDTSMSDQYPDIPGYDVEAEIGRGGMGVVYRVRQRQTGSVLALKMILGSRGASFAEL